jgi:hypothetical protein
MPAIVAKRGGKWRVVEKGTGKLVTKNNKAVDGGGHSSKKAAQAQATAINIPKSQRK